MKGLQKKACLIFILLISISSFIQAQSHFVLVHGAWHGSWAWFEMEELLTKAGHEVESIHLPGHGNDNIYPGSVTLEDYKNKIIDFLDTLDHPVILVGHSMGGIVISSVAESRPGKIEKLVYLSAFLLKNGQSLLDVANMDIGSKVLPHIIIDEALGTIQIDKNRRRELFYQLTPGKYVSFTSNLLVPNPLQPFATPLTLSDYNYGVVRRFYITTIKDNAITAEIQKYMYTMSPCEKVYPIYTDHSSFFSTPNQLLNILLEITNDESGNILKNHQFDESKNNWAFTVYNPDNITAVYSIDNTFKLSGVNSAHISVDNNGSQNWHIQFYQLIEAIKKGKTYEVSFLAKIGNPETEVLNISLSIIDLNFKTLWIRNNIEIHNNVQSFGPYHLNSNSDIENVLFIFDVENINDVDLYLDEIILNPN